MRKIMTGAVLMIAGIATCFGQNSVTTVTGRIIEAASGEGLCIWPI